MAQDEMVPAFDLRSDTHPCRGHQYYARYMHRYRQRDQEQASSQLSNGSPRLNDAF
jgi:hypothetical protein